MLSNKDLEQLLSDDRINDVGLDSPVDDIVDEPEPIVGPQSEPKPEPKLDPNLEPNRVVTPAAVDSSANVEDVTEQASAERDAAAQNIGKTFKLFDSAVTYTFVHRATQISRINDGCRISYRLSDGEPMREGVLGDGSLPWALEAIATRLSIGDIVDITATGVHTLADNDECPPPEEPCKWQLEIVSATASGTHTDKFRMSADERMERATQLRLKGNAMMQRGRWLRAGDYYEKGSSFLDVIEAEDFGYGNKNPEAVAANKRIRETQMPLLLNWSVVLMRQRKWSDAIQKCDEVLADVDSKCVKAYLRRGQCRMELGLLDDARKDLQKAHDFDESVADEVRKVMVQLEHKQKVVDKKDAAWARRAVKNAFTDSRSEKLVAQKKKEPEEDGSDNDGIDCHVAESSKARVNPSNTDITGSTSPVHPMMAALKSQEESSSTCDDITWCRQREHIYNSFLRGEPSDDVDKDMEYHVAEDPKARMNPRPDTVSEKGSMFGDMDKMFDSSQLQF